MLPARYFAFAACVLAFVAAAALAVMHYGQVWWWVAAVAGFLTIVGIRDVTQDRQSIRRNYPVLAHIRFFLEEIRPEIRQYFLEADTDETPFSRAQRSIVYQRAKNQVDKRPFGTQLDVYTPQYEWMNHSMAPAHVESHDFRISIGGPQCTQPYSASVFNISAMSYGALSPNAVLALNEGARRGRFFHDTGEGSISRFHREPGGDLVWEIGSGYFGCRNDDGTFSEERFKANAASPQVKMIEIKLSQGAKPGHGGVLPGAKVTKDISEARGVPIGQDCISPASHSAFSSPVGLMQFVARLRELSGGKPTGFKLAIGHPWEWFGIAKAMLETGIVPDFIVVDGGEGVLHDYELIYYPYTSDDGTPEGAKLPLGDEPMLPTEVNLQTSVQSLTLRWRDQAGRRLSMELSEEMALGLMRLMDKALAESAWDKPVMSSVAPPAAPGSALLN